MRIINYISLIAIIFLLSCKKKEDKILKHLVGKWNITEYKGAGLYKNDFTKEVTTIDFIEHKKAYTSTLKAIYKIDYIDPIKIDIIDTFRYELKQNEFDISYTQKQTNSKLLRNRFKIEGYNSSDLTLTRIDSTNLFIKATKQ